MPPISFQKKAMVWPAIWEQLTWALAMGLV